MKKASVPVFAVLMILLTAQLAGHIYNRIFYTQKSVLDVENKPEDTSLKERSLSLKELSMIYADAEKRIKLHEKGKSSKGFSKYSGKENPYTRKNKIEEIIKNRESDHRSMTKIIFFWTAGLVLITAGSLVYRKFETAIGFPLIVSGFIQMAWITGPLFFTAGDNTVSSFILNIKLVFTVITIALLTLYWYFSRNYLKD